MYIECRETDFTTRAISCARDILPQTKTPFQHKLQTGGGFPSCLPMLKHIGALCICKQFSVFLFRILTDRRTCGGALVIMITILSLGALIMCQPNVREWVGGCEWVEKVTIKIISAISSRVFLIYQLVICWPQKTLTAIIHLGSHLLIDKP